MDGIPKIILKILFVFAIMGAKDYARPYLPAELNANNEKTLGYLIS